MGLYLKAKIDGLLNYAWTKEKERRGNRQLYCTCVTTSENVYLLLLDFINYVKMKLGVHYSVS